eukprot:scaffold327591_cov63-Tisochrysis_lutea.AAC.1
MRPASMSLCGPALTFAGMPLPLLPVERLLLQLSRLRERMLKSDGNLHMQPAEGIWTMRDGRGGCQSSMEATKKKGGVGGVSGDRSGVHQTDMHADGYTQKGE